MERGGRERGRVKGRQGVAGHIAAAIVTHFCMRIGICACTIRMCEFLVLLHIHKYVCMLCVCVCVPVAVSAGGQAALRLLLLLQLRLLFPFAMLCPGPAPPRGNYFNKFKPQRNNKQFVFRLKCNFHNFLYKAPHICPFFSQSTQSTLHTPSPSTCQRPRQSPQLLLTYFIYSTASCINISQGFSYRSIVPAVIVVAPFPLSVCMCWQAFIMHFPIYL